MDALRRPRRSIDYQPLQGSEIRLLKFLPSPPDGLVCCTMVHVSLDQKPDFCALSYVWGDPKDPIPMVINGRVFDITQRLFLALRCLQKAPINPEICGGEPAAAAKPDIYWWIDAICINQNDLAEKASQVPRMRHIYGSATRVAICFGDVLDDMVPDMGRLFAVARRFGQQLLAQESQDTYLEVLFEQLVWTKIDEPVKLATALAGLASSDWFERVWVLQESIVPSVSPLVIAGEFVTDLEDLFLFEWCLYSLALLEMHENRAVIVDQIDHQQFIMISNGRFEKIKMKREQYQSRAKQNATEPNNEPMKRFAKELSHALIKLEGRKSTFQHDKIYGLLGLSTLPPLLPEKLLPDYGLPYQTVFYEYTKFIIEETCSLDILRTKANESPGVPTWVPDFGPEFTDPETHSNVTICQPRFSLDGKEMTLDGCLLTTCLALFEREDMRKNIYNPAQAFEIVSKFHMASVKPAAAMNGVPTAKIWGQLTSYGLHDIGIKIEDTMVILNVLEEAREPTEDELASFSQLLFAVARTLLVNTPFLTIDGRIGVGSRFQDSNLPLPSNGDLIVVFRGLAVPARLRPAGAKFEFVAVVDFLDDYHVKDQYGNDFFVSREARPFTLV
jgi:hypothetical protein